MSPLAAIDCTSPIPPSGAAADLDLLAAFLEDRVLPDFGRTAAALLIDTFGGLAGVAAADAAALIRSGLPSGAVADLGRVRALALAMARAEACRRPVLSSWTALMTYLRSSLAHAPREQFRTLYLDKRNILMREELRADGTIDHAPVYVATVVDCYLALAAGRRLTNSRQCASEGARR